MKILVTGSRGFVGASFGVFASVAGHEVLGISRSSQPEPGWPGRHVQGDAGRAGEWHLKSQIIPLKAEMHSTPSPVSANAGLAQGVDLTLRNLSR